MNCAAPLLFAIPAPRVLAASLGDDVVITLGDSVRLVPNLNFVPQSWRWLPRTDLRCDTCLSTFAVPTYTTNYRLELRDSSGCIIETNKNITVEKKRRVFIPDNFSPNNDGENDRFMVFTDNESVIIQRFEVYNRWGNRVFEARNILPNNPLEGWDGTWRGEQLPSGTFIYYLFLEFKDGSVLQYQGDVFLVR